MNESIPGGNQEKEVSVEAKEALAIFRKAFETTDELERQRLAQDFLTRIYALLIEGVKGEPPVEDRRYIIAEVAQEILGQRQVMGDNSRIIVGSGSSGRRIRFGKKHPDRFGQGDQEQVRWMWYRKPSQEDWKSSHAYWENFMKHFGEEVVDLLQ